MFWSCLFCVAACLRVCMCAVGTSAWGSVWLWDCVGRWMPLALPPLRWAAEPAVLFGRVIDTS